MRGSERGALKRPASLVSVTLVTAVLTLAVAGVGASPRAMAAATGPQVDAAVQVTSMPAPTRAYVAPELAVHPDNPDIVALGAGEARSSTCSLHVSTSAGLSWTELSTPEPDGTKCVWSNAGPVLDLAFGPRGTLYYAFSAGTQEQWPQRTIYVARSDDLGRSFTTVT